MKKYKQLSPEQRYTIEQLLYKGYTQSSIADILEVNKSTISRELKRNISKRGRLSGIYCAQNAQRKTEIRHKDKRKSIRLDTTKLKYIRDKLKQQRWSPEYISERGKLELGDFVCHETIYLYIWKTKHSNKRQYAEDKELHKYLRHHKRRRKRKNSKENRGMIPDRVSIDQRPTIIDERKRSGDFEVDLMMGTSHRPGLIVMTDRKNLETKLIKTNTKEAKEIARKIIQRIRRDNQKVHSLTFDNDLAFADHKTIGKALGCRNYFTRPYTSQDKGTVENRIGVIRRFFPKGTDMSLIHHSTIKSVERKLNNRPVRKFNYLTPNEKKKSIRSVALII